MLSWPRTAPRQSSPPAGVPTEFSVEALTEAAAIDKAGIHEKEKAQRLDLRDRIIFTIDSADTKISMMPSR